MVSPGVYEKDAPVWAKQAEKSGTIQTKEGSTAYEAGDYLVFNDPSGKDGYAMTQEKFQSLYELPYKRRLPRQLKRFQVSRHNRTLWSI